MMSTASAERGTIEPTTRPQELADEVVSLVRRWLREAAGIPSDSSAARLAGVLRDPRGLDFTVGFIDGVVRPEDLEVAANRLAALIPLTPKFLPIYMRGAIRLGGALARPLPRVVVPLARVVLRRMVSHLVIDASDAKLGRAIAKIKRRGIRLNVNLLGEAILGQAEAERRLAGTQALLARNDVDYVSIKVSSTVAPHNHWAFDEAVEQVEKQLLPLFRHAATSSPKKFINLDMEEYKDLDLTVAVFTRLLERPEFQSLEAGIVLQAYLPDALGAMIRLQDWARSRVARGGAPIKVRLVKGANLPMELVDAAIHGWPSAVWPSKRESDTNYKAVLDYALHPDRVRNVRIGVAGHNLFDVALAWLLAKARGAEQGIEFEMLLGMATGQAEAVRREVGSLLLYTPVVQPEEFDVAIAYLIRRLEEGASQENFMSAVFELEENADLFEREKERFLASLAHLESITGDGSDASLNVPTPRRIQDRRAYDASGAERRVDELVADPAGAFRNTPDTDPDLPGNRQWGRQIASRMASSQLGTQTVRNSLIRDSAALDTVLERGVEAASAWQQLGADERARILHRAGERMEERRAQLLEVMGAECGKTLDQGDPEVSEAIDFAHYYAAQGQQLSAVDGAVAVPQKLIAVIPPWNFPVAIPAGGVLAALAAGSAVVIKPASQAARSAAVMVEALWDAGVPRDVLQMVQFADRDLLGPKFVSDDRVDRLILTGAYETAASFRGYRADLPLLAETSGKNAIIVTPNADLDLAAKDVVQSAFGHAGQKCSAASLVILVGSVATSTRFRSQLIDAVRSLTVGTPDQLESQMGPLIAAPSGKLLRGLTTLGPGERWVIRPQELCVDSPLARDREGQSTLWGPGVREGVRRGSEFHLTEYFGPILGIMTAATLEEAIDTVNEIDYGLTSGLHSLDATELAVWLERVEAGNLYANRGITGAIVRRQPFGGWKKSAVGAGTKAGGPSYLYGLVDWRDSEPSATASPLRSTVSALLDAARESGLGVDELVWLRAAVQSDAHAWDEEFGANRDPSNLGVERNVLRYRPTPVIVRVAADASVAHAVRVISAGLAGGSVPVVSTKTPLAAPLLAALSRVGVEVHVESGPAWDSRLRTLSVLDGPDASARIRIVAGPSRPSQVARAFASTKGKPDIAIYGGEVVSAGRVEMLAHLREQAVSITAHRFGTPNALSEGLF